MRRRNWPAGGAAMRGAACAASLAASLAAALAAAPAAGARPIPVQTLVAGPVLAGGTVVWAEERDGEVELRSAARDGGDGRLLARLGRTPQLQGLSLSGAPDGYALAISTGQPAAPRVDSGTLDRDAVMAGGPGEPPRLLAACDRSQPYPIAAGQQVFAARALGAVASRVRTCGQDSSSSPPIEIRTPPEPGEPQRRLTASAGALSASYYASVEPAPSGDRQIAVLDWRQDRPAYTVPVQDVVADGLLSDLRVADDGRIAFLVARRGEERVWTATPSDPRPRLVPVAQGEGYALQLSGARLGFARSGRGAEVGSYDFTMGRETVVADRLVLPDVSGPGFDLQGDALVWRAASCRGTTLRVGGAAEPAPPAARPRCRLALDRAPRVGRRRVAVAFACSGYSPDDCPGKVTIRSARRPHRLLARGRTDGDADVAAGHMRATLRLTAAGRRGRRAGRRVIVTASTRDALGRPERRSARVRTVAAAR